MRWRALFNIMARSVNEIQNEIITTVQATPELAAATSTSKRAIWRLWAYVVAVSIALLEQLIDIFVTETEVKISQSYEGSSLWLQTKAYEFQYSAAVPQVIQIINGSPAYPSVNAALRIVTACSIKTSVPNYVTIKVAKGNPFESFSTLQLSSISNYFSQIGIAGINYQVASFPADQIYIAANIYFDGQYASIIKTSVIDALNAYLSAQALTNFDAYTRVSDLEYCIKSIAGVVDVVLTQVSARTDGNDFGSEAFILVTGGTVVARQYQSSAGYLIGETTTGYTFADSLTFIAA